MAASGQISASGSGAERLAAGIFRRQARTSLLPRDDFVGVAGRRMRRLETGSLGPAGAFRFSLVHLSVTESPCLMSAITAGGSPRAASGRRVSPAGPEPRSSRRVQSREFGLDVVELLQGLAAAGAEAFVQVGRHVVHGGGSLLASPAVERVFAGCSPAAASPARQAAGRTSSMSSRAGCLCCASQTPAAGIWRSVKAKRFGHGAIRPASGS